MSAIKRKATDLALAESKKPKVNASITSFFGTPKSPKPVNDKHNSLVKDAPTGPGSKVTETTDSAPAPAPIFGATGTGSAATTPVKKFDKAAWVDGLKPETRDLLQLEIDTLDESWLAVLKDEITSIRFLGLKKFLAAELSKGQKVFPPMEDVYSWSRHTPLHTVRAVILGQDPYHNHNQAHGLCFSVRPPTPAPPSLKNIYTALKNDYPAFTPPPKNGGLLTPWADSGVLMLNTCLTVRAHEANSHAKKGWEEFTQKVIDLVAAKRNQGVVFLAWGSPAQKRLAKISGNKHLVLKSVHPSPLSAHKGEGFFKTGQFKKANEWLRERYGAEGEIRWDLSAEKVEEAGV